MFYVIALRADLGLSHKQRRETIARDWSGIDTRIIDRRFKTREEAERCLSHVGPAAEQRYEICRAIQ